VSRTPLFRAVRRSLQLARASLTHPAPVDELIDQGRESARLARESPATLTRRRFVAVSSVAAAGLALEGCAPAITRATRTTRPVLIIGGGMAGLAAGYRLRQGGVPVRILEAQRRSGGRMWSLRDHFADGQLCELGGELIDTGHTHIRELATELGIELDDLSAEPAGIGQELYYFGGARRGEAEIVSAFRPIASHIAADLAALGEGDISFRAPSGAEQMDRMTLEEWLERSGADGWIRSLLSVAYTAEFGLPPERQSALNLLTMIDPSPEPFRIFGESDERFHVRGGNDLIPQRLAGRMDDAIETGHVLEAVASHGAGYRLAFRSGGASRDVVADQVILALPFTLLRKVRIDVPLPPAKRRAIDTLAYGTNAKLMIGFDRRVWREHGANGASMSDLAYQTTWDTSRKQPGAGVLTNFTGGRHGVALGEGTPKAQADAAARDLDRLWPGALAARAGAREVRMHWPSNPWALGSYACLRPGDWSGLRGVIGASVGSLHFAGEHCAPETQGFMEGGCESGETAAAAVLAGLGIGRKRAA
jgi:monoamine oxidase